MARRTAFLCLGLPGALGSGTVADLLVEHADSLSVAGHRIAATPDVSRRAVLELTRDGDALAAAGLARRDVEGTWEGVWRTAYRARPRNAVLAEDGLAAATSDQVALTLDALAGFTVHLVVVAADPADLLARAWTAAVAEDRPMPLLRFRDRLEQSGPGHEQARRWWAAHHLPGVLERWGAHVPAHRVHVVVASGDERHRVQQVGRSLGTLLGTRALLGTLAATPASRPRALPSTVLAAMRTEGRDWADALRASPYDVHGDPDALVAPCPADVEDEAATLADLTADDRLHLAGDALADALSQLEGLRRENARLRVSASAPHTGRRRLLRHRVPTR
ncbi:hypothetical protein [Nocardioides sp. CFH 31398]|uniref:hypothetical protein n=1 Tax=Nocardioides sp. CFH 31398 TaxID=2919579 RepID=UPI001F05B309|nr:hypothetical protein [Nocardioides sp. CFH 31398]MCH1864959.1 hypothetical protein [Nocardioides sp. CFH 31398]